MVPPVRKKQVVHQCLAAGELERVGNVFRFGFPHRVSGEMMMWPVYLVGSFEDPKAQLQRPHSRIVDDRKSSTLGSREDERGGA